MSIAKSARVGCWGGLGLSLGLCACAAHGGGRSSSPGPVDAAVSPQSADAALAQHAADAAFADAGDDAGSETLPKPGDPAADSRQAVQDTLHQNAACQAIAPFYYEIGKADGPSVSGSVGTAYARDTAMEIASASKWLYTSYYVQKTHGQIDETQEVKFLNFTSGFASINGACLGMTVNGCNDSTMNTAPGTTTHPGTDDSAVDRFDYNSGHLEAHAARYGGLGDDRALTLPKDLQSQLGSEIAMTYVNPLLAGGARMSAGDYATFLQKILAGELIMHDLLGTHAVCTLSSEYASLFHETCNAVLSPWWPATSGKLADTPDTSLVQDVHYSLGHWVESDGAFSSPGLYGFYPWIDKSKTWYGMIARRQVFQVFDEAHPDTSAYAQSVQCGQAVRAAWFDGTPHP